MIKAKINKSWYQKTKVSQDGTTQVVLPETYDLYEVNIDKVYFIESKIEMLKALREDLEQLCIEIDTEIGLEYKKLRKKER